MKKFIKLFVVCLLCNSGESFADEMASAHQAGASFSREQGGKVIDVPRSGDLQTIPQYEAPSSQENQTPHYTGASLSEEVKSLGNRSRERQFNERGPLSWKKPTSPAEEASDFIHQSKIERGVFPLDPETDPLLQHAKGVLEPVLEAKSTSQDSAEEEEVWQESDSTSLHTCFESLEPKEVSCVTTLEVKTRMIPGNPLYEKRCTRQNCREECWGRWRRRCHDVCDCAEWQDHQIGTEPDEVVLDSETWIDGCAPLESLSDEGRCAYVEKICTQGSKTQGPETRVINGVSVYRDCWQYRSTYLCDGDHKEDCKHLKEKGCFQIASSCAEHTRVEHTRDQESPKGCALYKQTYQCLEGGKTTQGQRHRQSMSVFCGDGTCADQTYAANQDMLDSISKLHLLKEMQKDLGGQTLVSPPFAIFKGEDRRCSKSCLGFSDCCGLSGGWGEITKMTSCSGEEKDLSQRRAKGLCRLVGTYCAEKENITKVCLRKKTSYCCFPSKLVRLFQEQGRAQLNLGWGDPEYPSCRGLTVEELQKVDFSKVDAREIFQEIASTYRPGKQGEQQRILQEKTLESLQENMKNIQSGLKVGGM